MSELSVKINIVNTNVYNSENTLPNRNNFGVAFFVMIVMAHPTSSAPVIVRIVDTMDQSASALTHGTSIASCRPVEIFERLHPRRLLCLRQIQLIS